MIGYADTIGGEGGQILIVTSLADSGPNTLREACGASFKRIVKFDPSLSGVIQLSNEIRIKDNCTVDGIDAQELVIKGARLAVKGNDVILENLRISPLDGAGQNKGSRDCIGIGNKDRTIKGVIVKGCSMKWSTDECAGTWTDSSGLNAPENVTYVHNLFLQPLRDAGHPEGAHGMGSLIGNGTKNITIARNIYAGCDFRNPSIKGDCKKVEVFNNLVYSWGNTGMQFHDYADAVIAGNVFVEGLHSSSDLKRQLRLKGGVYHVWDNIPQRWETRSGASVVQSMPVGYTGSGYLANDWIDPALLIDYLLIHAGAIYPRHADDEEILDLIRQDETVNLANTGTIKMIPVT